jgi:hypothetical protein
MNTATSTETTTHPLPLPEATTTDAPTNEALFDALRLAADANDDIKFLQAFRQLDKTTLLAEDYEQLIHLALATDLGMLGRRLANEGTERYPHYEPLAKFALALAPPKFLRFEPASNKDGRINRQWLRENGAQYSGLWVALRDGKFYGAAETPLKLAETLGDLKKFFITIAH